MCGGAGEALASIDPFPAIGQGLSEVDKFVGREIPGGWTLPAAIAVAYATGYLDPSLFAAEGATVVGSEAAATAAGEAAYSSAIASGATAAEATAAANSAAASYATGASGAGLLDAAAIAEGGTTAGMGTAANTGLPIGTETIGGVVGGGAPIVDYSSEVVLSPGGNYVPATTLPTEMAALDAEIASAAASAPTKISPMQAIQGIRSASGLLGGGQQQQQQMPQMQMGGRQQMPQGAVDYSGIYNLLALQRARNPNSLLG
jgi:hypothetical protein